MSSVERKSLIRLWNIGGRYVLLTGLGSYLLLTSLAWSAETSFLGAAVLAVLLELFVDQTLKAKRNQFLEETHPSTEDPTSITRPNPLNLRKRS